VIAQRHVVAPTPFEHVGSRTELRLSGRGIKHVSAAFFDPRVGRDP
jgi:hypothetical protein